VKLVTIKMANQKAIYRLLQYRTCLERFKELGFEKVYSHNLGLEAGVSAEQVRKDFSRFNLKGNKKGGYEISSLLEELDVTFGKHEVQKVFLVGMGNIGNALSHYKGFANKKISIAAAFDIDPSKVKKGYSIPVYPLRDLKNQVESQRIRAAILAVPESQAQAVCDLMVESGIKGIMNFAPIVPKVKDGIKVNNINLSNELESLLYHVKLEG
jgi:redox-sensing transcriptional repressor